MRAATRESLFREPYFCLFLLRGSRDIRASVEIRLIVLFLGRFFALATATTAPSAGDGHRGSTQLAGLAGLPSQSVLRRVAAQLGRHQIQRQVARVDVVLRAAVLAGVHVLADAATAAGVKVLLRYPQVVLEGLKKIF